MKKIFTLLFLLVCSTIVLSQTTYYVKPTGNDANDGLSWATAFKTLQKATNTINTGEIWVAAGTYYPDEGMGQTTHNRGAYYTLKNAVAIYGGFPASGSPSFFERDWKTYPTILSGEIQQDGNSTNNSYHVVQCSVVTPSAILDGLTITGGNANGEWPNDQGGGLHCSNYGGNSTTSGPIVRNCSFVANYGKDGAGIYNYWYASTRITNCTFSRNIATRLGGAIYNYTSYPTITNSVFWKNSAPNGGAMYDDLTVHSSVINCSFYGNTATTGACLSSNVSSSLYVRNSIFWGSTNSIYSDRSLWSSITVNYCIIQGGDGAAGNTGADPLFVNSSTGDLHVQPCSPAIDAGLNSFVPPDLVTDMDGNDRIVDRVDMGAYESQGQVIYVNQNATGHNNGSSWANAFTKLQNALAYQPPCAHTVQVWVAKGTYYPDETSTTNTNNPASSFSLQNNRSIYGGFDGSETKLFERSPRTNVTILSGDINADNASSGNSYHVVRSSAVDSTAILDGFTITGGNANIAGNNRGGGMLNESASPTIVNCIFEDNYALDGGAMYNASSSVKLENCQFSTNRSNYGGAIYNYSNAPHINRCMFKMNSASYDGGGIYNYWSSARITNSVFWVNTATSGAGVNNFFSNGVSIVNCSFWGNTANDGGGVYNWVATPVVANCIFWSNSAGQLRGDAATASYSIIQDNYTGTNILTTNPLFTNAPAGNLSLMPGSPAINAGNDAEVPADVTRDLSGFSRFSGRVDMGAYEYGSTSSGPGPSQTLKMNLPPDFKLTSDPDKCGRIVYFTGEHAATTTGAIGPVSLTYSPTTGSLLQVGKNTVRVEAVDSAGQMLNGSFEVTILDSTSPVITCPVGKVTLFTELNACSYTIRGTSLDVTATDNCSGPLTYAYTLTGATTSPMPRIITGMDGVVLNKGETNIHYIVQDASGNETTCDRLVTVVDNKAPQITGLMVDKPVLYPPNHQMQDITVEYNTSDNCEVVSTTLFVSSNEGTNINGAGNTSIEWQVIDDHHVKLMAERAGTGIDRIYTITVNTMDAAGLTASATVTVTVPHDKGAVMKNRRVAGTEDITGLQVSAAPNPFTNGFTLSIQSPSSTPLDIRVFDAAGRLLERRNGLVPNEIQYFGQTYRPGVFHVQVIQEDEIKTLKLVKQ